MILMKTMNDIITRIDQEIESIIIMDDYDGGKVAGLRFAKDVLLEAKDEGPRYFGCSSSENPLN